ncbi:histidine phosphatase family protein [Streptomyces sp. NPDC059096]|uniref:histidine phosphatase family protein n=1 Tax=Streptomyces sp. NPDC059096 TaxID=3346727 RepID=UPI0036D02EA9
MTIRVLLVSPAIGPALRAARFGEEPPEGRGPEAPGSGAVESGAVDAAGNGAATAGGRCAAQDDGGVDGARGAPRGGPTAARRAAIRPTPPAAAPDGHPPPAVDAAGPGPATAGGRCAAPDAGGVAGAVDAAGVRQTEAVREDFLRTARTAALYVSPTPRCRATARLLGLDARPLPDLAPWAMGRWRGRTLDEVAAAEPREVNAWLTDPAAAPHGGETLLALQARVGRWLDTLGQDTPRVVAVAEPDIVRAATVHALGTAAATFWRLDVRPLTATELTGRNGRWNLLSGRPLADGGAGEEN